MLFDPDQLGESEYVVKYEESETDIEQSLRQYRMAWPDVPSGTTRNQGEPLWAILIHRTMAVGLS